MEIWKDIVGYEGLYQVSNLGNVMSLELNIQESRIVDILMHDVEDELETVLYDDCEEAES